jgi:hypothetical protein
MSPPGRVQPHVNNVTLSDYEGAKKTPSMPGIPVARSLCRWSRVIETFLGIDCENGCDHRGLKG